MEWYTARYENPEKTLWDKKSGNVLLDRMQCIKLRGLELFSIANWLPYVKIRMQVRIHISFHCFAKISQIFHE